MGGYDDWVRQRAARSATLAAAGTRSKAASSQAPDRPARPDAAKSTKAGAETKRRPTFKERQELQALPALIETIEAELATLHAEMARPEYYRQAGERIAQEAAGKSNWTGNWPMPISVGKSWNNSANNAIAGSPR